VRGRTAGRARGTHGEPHERWLVSYADLVTLLLALFVVLYAAADAGRARAVAEAVRAQFGGGEQGPAGSGVLPGGDSFDETEAAIARAFAERDALRQNASMRREGRGLIVSLSEAGFFAPGDATVRGAEAQAAIAALAEALAGGSAPVRVEGHTDSQPISNARYPSNWELSAARASTVLARLAASGVAPERLSIAGYAGERPVATNATPEGRALNRRVDIIVLGRGD
jgi:chemotaxis protein MotB